MDIPSSTFTEILWQAIDSGHLNKILVVIFVCNFFAVNFIINFKCSFFLLGCQRFFGQGFLGYARLIDQKNAKQIFECPNQGCGSGEDNPDPTSENKPDWPLKRKQYWSESIKFPLNFFLSILKIVEFESESVSEFSEKPDSDQMVLRVKWP